jgi:riboflavin biosynthesis pyrimidine reductase
MRVLLPEPSSGSVASPGAAGPSAVDLHAWYGQGWSDVGGLRLDMVTSVDGAASVAGRSAGLQTPGDNAVFAVLRDLSDVILVGAGTARAEGYGPAVPGPARQARRRELGYPPIARIAVVSRSLDIDPASPLIAGAAPGCRTLVVTHSASDLDRRAALERAGAEVVVAGDGDVNLVRVREELMARGLRRIVCEGGPTLLADLVAARAADELCLSSTPWLAGPGAGRISAGRPWEGVLRAELTHLLEEDGALFARYRLPR